MIKLVFELLIYEISLSYSLINEGLPALLAVGEKFTNKVKSCYKIVIFNKRRSMVAPSPTKEKYTVGQ